VTDVVAQAKRRKVKEKKVPDLSVVLYQDLTQLWCNANWLRKSSGEQPSAKQFEAGATIHLPLERFQPVDVAFHRVPPDHY
jgi:hypothetical protein